MEKDIVELIAERHSVRQYLQKPIEGNVRALLEQYIEALNKESGLDIRLLENKKVFGGAMLMLAGWKNPPLDYFALLAEKNDLNEQKCGYYGEKLVLYAQALGLNTCWVGMFKKGAVKAQTKKTALVTIAVGYGENAGKQRKSKNYEQVCEYNGEAPEWFKNGVKCALLAPTAINRQAFFIHGDGNKVVITCNNSVFANVDLGIVKYHFEQGAGKENFEWA